MYHSPGFLAFGQVPPSEINKNYRLGFEEGIAQLQSAYDTLVERLEDLGETEAGKALRAIEGLDLHREIEGRAARLFKDGHYAEAVEAAYKALNLLVKLRSGRDDLDGAALMLTVFSVKDPVLTFNELKDDSDRSEQQGMMHLFAGTVLAFRNPSAHKFMEDNPERALEYIAFISLLAKLLDGAK